MKGIVTDYREEKGFGFIKDENEENRFFHINSIRDKKLFLNNIADYYFSEDERKCYVLQFNPSQNEKGLNAQDIILTKQVFNEIPIESELEVKIKDIEYYTDSLTRTVSGIKKGGFVPFGTTAGGNGTYRVGYPEVLKELNIYFRRVDDIGWGTIDVRELVLAINDRSKITEKLLDTLRNQLIGEAAIIGKIRNKWALKDTSILEV